MATKRLFITNRHAYRSDQRPFPLTEEVIDLSNRGSFVRAVLVNDHELVFTQNMPSFPDFIDKQKGNYKFNPNFTPGDDVRGTLYIGNFKYGEERIVITLFDYTPDNAAAAPTGSQSAMPENARRMALNSMFNFYQNELAPHQGTGPLLWHEVDAPENWVLANHSHVDFADAREQFEDLANQHTLNTVGDPIDSVLEVNFTNLLGDPRESAERNTILQRIIQDVAHGRAIEDDWDLLWGRGSVKPHIK